MFLITFTIYICYDTFLSILLVSMILGLIGGIPVATYTDADGNTINGIATVIGNGFSGTFTSIGIVIIFGAMIGSFLEATGAALKLADMVVKLVGPKHPELAIELMGWVVSIPVFCDSGFVVLNPIRKALVKRTGTSSVAMTVALSAGLYASHVFIPPTPGPIVIPIILMAMSNVASILGWTGALNATFTFLGTPIIALAVGVILGIIVLVQAEMGDKLYELTNDTLKTVGPILFVTAAGGVLGKVISSTSLVAFITEQADVLQSIGIFFPILHAAILKTAQGSSTVAITTTAGIMAPLMGALGMDSTIMSALCVMAIGAGAMTVSHANDSYFWVVTNFGSMTPDQGYKTQTLGTLVQGLCAIIFIFILTLIFH